MELLAILAFALSVISGLGTGICALLYRRQESLQPKESEELMYSIKLITKEKEQFLEVKDKEGNIIKTREIKDSENVENEAKKIALSL